jgi:hypothetical protein
VKNIATLRCCAARCVLLGPFWTQAPEFKGGGVHTCSQVILDACTCGHMHHPCSGWCLFRFECYDSCSAGMLHQSLAASLRTMQLLSPDYRSEWSCDGSAVTPQHTFGISCYSDSVLGRCRFDFGFLACSACGCAARSTGVRRSWERPCAVCVWVCLLQYSSHCPLCYIALHVALPLLCLVSVCWSKAHLAIGNAHLRRFL